MAPDILEVKIGAQVMFLVNDADRNLFNGSRGVIIDIDDSGYPKVQFKNGKVFTIEPYTWNSYIKIEGEKYKMARTQIPLKLCWATSIHKS
jgi:ATP-dependent exoDNAse (exonuclease V) alpha subunit